MEVSQYPREMNCENFVENLLWTCWGCGRSGLNWDIFGLIGTFLDNFRGLVLENSRWMLVVDN